MKKSNTKLWKTIQWLAIELAWHAFALIGLIITMFLSFFGGAYLYFEGWI